jgi:GxxExxY protein
MEFDQLSSRVIGCAIEVHRVLGPGLLESAYQHCLAHEMQLCRIRFCHQWPLPVEYKGARLNCGYSVDLLVENQLVVEVPKRWMRLLESIRRKS